MSDVTTNAPAAPAPRGDERLAYRGVFQRLLIRPEIGALVGAVAIWLFFWAVADVFGTAGGTASILDVAATLGIMAVAVSLLMIGGEFDLSSGANTGAMGIVVILLVKETGELGGAGLSLWVAIPISFVVAMGIGYFNGFMVERTKLPSFIVTLGTFFVLRGAKLGFSKLIVDQIQVGRVDEGDGYDFWVDVFAAEWGRNDHQLEARDLIFLVLTMLGLAALVIGTFELHFLRRAAMRPAGLFEFLVGLVAFVAGIVILHTTDGSSGDILGAVVIGVGITATLAGFSAWRFERIADRGALSFTPAIIRLLVISLALAAGGVFFALVFDSDSEEAVFFPFTEQGLRATLFVGLAVASVAVTMVAAAKANRVSAMTKAAVSSYAAVLVAFFAFFIRSQSTSAKFRAEAFSALLVVALLMLLWAVLGALYEERRSVDAPADRLGSRLIRLGIISLAFAMIVRLLFTTQAEIDGGLAPAKFSMRIVWFALVTAVAAWVLGRTRFGSWTFAVGGNKDAARQVGVPAARTKTQLFMIVAGCAWLVGLLLAFRLNTIQAGTGDGLEFEYIIAAVVGGTLLTGGFGTAIGGAIGALIMAMSVQGIPSARWNSDWRYVFLGVILLTAVIANRSIRTRAEAVRR